MKLKKTKWIYLTTAMLLSISVFSQFERVGKGLTRNVRTLYSDSLTNGLLVGGDFVWTEGDSLVVNSMAVWNGIKWDSVAQMIQPIFGALAPGIEKFYRYKGDLYATGLFRYGLTDPTYPSVIAKLDTIAKKWNPVSCIMNGYGMIHSGFEIDDTIYVTGLEDTLCGNAPTMVYKHDGTNFFPSNIAATLPNYINNSISSLFEYQGILYLTGGIWDPSDSSFKLFLKWDGSNWVDVPGAGGQVMTIRKMMIYNGELYASGYFFKGQGSPGNCIAKFDGTTWSDLGGGVCVNFGSPDCCSANIKDFTFYNGDLFVVGTFNYAGGVPAQNIAKWDGTNWCGLGNTNIDNQVEAIAVWNDSLYIAGGFKYIDGDTMNYIAKWTGTLGSCSTIGINESQLNAALNIYPNPSTNQITIEFDITETKNYLLKLLKTEWHMKTEKFRRIKNYLSETCLLSF